MPGSFAGTFQERLSQKCSPLLVSNFLHSFLQSVGAGSRDSSKIAKNRQKSRENLAFSRNLGLGRRDSSGSARLSRGV